MYRLYTVCGLFILSFLISNEKTIGQNNINWAVEQLKVLSPDEYQILHCYDQLPEKFSVKTDMGTLSSYKSGSTLQFMHEGDKVSCLMNIETDVHEVNHMITSAYPYEYCRIHNRVLTEKNMYYFYIGKGNDTVLFSNVDFFPSQNIISEIPDTIRTFRFSTYIEGDLSTQDDGLLGLLDEYNSYHHSMTTTWELRNAYLTGSKDKVKGYITWMGSLNTLVQAYYEFRFFILEYLRYAKLNAPDVYEQIKDETGLITVFNQITVSYRAILSNHENEIAENGQVYWQKLGYKAYIDDKREFYFIGKDGAATGFQVKMDDKDKLDPLLQSHRYDELINDLKIIK
jgi:hypothetical protein